MFSSLLPQSFLAVAAYTANLASFLVSRSQPEIAFHTIQEAAVVKIPICLQRGIAIDQYVSAKYPNANLIRKRTGRLVFDALNAGECEVAVVSLMDYENFRRKKEVNENCQLWWAGRVEQYVPSGLATAVDTGEYCTSLIDHVLDYHLLQMKFDGFFERVMGEFYERIGETNCASDTDIDLLALGAERRQEDGEDTRSLSLQEMSGIFIVHAALCIVSLLLAVGKFYVVRRKDVHSSVRRLFTDGTSLRSSWLSRIDEADTSDDGNGNESSSSTSKTKLTHKRSSSRASSAGTSVDSQSAIKDLPIIPEGSDEQQNLVSPLSQRFCGDEEEKKSDAGSVSDRRLSY